jgi:hypothetical protein
MSAPSGSEIPLPPSPTQTSLEDILLQQHHDHIESWTEQDARMWTPSSPSSVGLRRYHHPFGSHHDPSTPSPFSPEVEEAAYQLNIGTCILAKGMRPPGPGIFGSFDDSTHWAIKADNEVNDFIHNCRNINIKDQALIKDIETLIPKLVETTQELINKMAERKYGPF